ncbi:Hsp20/alpha crystallin family protein [Gorillibacterium sp. CAU 1737]
MSDLHEQEPWKSIHQLFGGKTPFMRMPEGMQGGDWVQAMVKDIVQRTVDSVTETAGFSPVGEPAWRAQPPREKSSARTAEQSTFYTSGQTAAKSGKAAPYSAGRPAVTTTDKAVIVRFRLPGGAQPEGLRLFADLYTLRLTGLPGGRVANVPLPVPVKVQGARARFHDEQLVVRLPRTTKTREQEIFIQY